MGLSQDWCCIRRGALRCDPLAIVSCRAQGKSRESDISWRREIRMRGPISGLKATSSGNDDNGNDDGDVFFFVGGSLAAESNMDVCLFLLFYFH